MLGASAAGVRSVVSLPRGSSCWVLVVGEGTRCWYGAQASLIAPKVHRVRVDLWVLESGGKVDPRNPSHKMLMSQLAAMSESERQHV
ncbi:MAG TPA: hypothetical protein VGD71_10215 [Kribbella sp.]